MEDVYTRFGRAIRRTRRQMGMTQDELAARVSLGRTSIVNIERGRQRVQLHTFLEIADALQVSPSDLIPNEPQSVPEIADQVDTLPAPERDWVMRVVSPAAPRPERRRTHGSKT